YVSVPPYRHYSVLLGHDSAPIPMLLMITVFAFGWSTFLSPWFAVMTGMVYAELNTATRKTASEITSAP
ncbi:MAG TPA: hypothetical protein VNO31_54175, partial [Umezawaea sp.]|nr:hypothetical protein [Umezawaea sp.]